MSAEEIQRATWHLDNLANNIIRERKREQMDGCSMFLTIFLCIRGKPGSDLDPPAEYIDYLEAP
jgi:hypothetical protein